MRKDHGVATTSRFGVISLSLTVFIIGTLWSWPVFSKDGDNFENILAMTLAKVRSIPVIVLKTVKKLVPGVVFSDCKQGGPVMVVIPAGRFKMGSSLSGKYRLKEKPVHTVTIVKPFAIGRYEITVGEYFQCVEDKKCSQPRWPGPTGVFGPTPNWYPAFRASLVYFNSPVTGINWFGAKAYVKWLSEKTGQTYRLPSEAEWEYVAKAGKGNKKYWWGDKPSHDFANYGKDRGLGRGTGGRDKWLYSAPVGSFPANPFKLHDLHGNVMEWVEDCYDHFSYKTAPRDGKAWYRKPRTSKCSMRVVRGGGSLWSAEYMRSSRRDGNFARNGGASIGFRVARDIR